jgi:hypothetical protein
MNKFLSKICFPKKKNNNFNTLNRSYSDVKNNCLFKRFTQNSNNIYNNKYDINSNDLGLKMYKIKKLNRNNSDHQNNFSQIIRNSNNSKLKSFNDDFKNYILCSKNLIKKRRENIQFIKIKKIPPLYKSNYKYPKKYKSMSMESYEIEKRKFKKLLFNEDIAYLRKKNNIETFLKQFKDHSFINKLYNAKFNH